MKMSKCPAIDVLSSFAVGRTTDDEAVAIETHLAACPQCVSALDRAKADSLVAAVKASLPEVRSSIAPSDEQPIAVEFPLDEGAQSTRIYLEQPTDTDTASVPATGNDVTEELYKFLLPTAEPGVIGRLGQYRILEQLGRGGMGAVFRAEDPQLQRPVALKVMRPHALGAPEASHRFLAEARAAAKLKHDHVVTIYQVGEDAGVAFIAMELLEGESLESRLARDGRLSIDDACRIGMETASALSAAHAAGLIHRDIKPANLWLDSSSGRTKVLDFGLARATDADVNLTSSGAILGTPAYMAPEQARGETIDGRTDLFALGVVLYRAMTGQLPFRGPNAVGTLLEVTTHTPPTPRSLRGDIPQELSALVTKLLAKVPAQRPQTAGEVSAELAAIRAHVQQAKVQRPDSVRHRPWKAIAAGLLAFCLAVASVIVIIRDRNGNKVAEISVASGATAEIRNEATPAAPMPVLTPRNSGGTENGAQEGKEPLPFNAPPALKEWLQDRTVLTVAQDGKGQFTTIQAALDALQPGQVVKVLDRGPYRESLRCTAPRDTGLISDVQTVVEAIDWPAETHPHDIVLIEGFRLNGFRVQARPRKGWFEILHVNTPSGLVVENCSFGLTIPDPAHTTSCSGLQLSFDQHRRASQPVWIRECLLEKNFGADKPFANGTIVVENNLFRDSSIGMGSGDLQTLVIRHNVFDNPTQQPIWFNGVASVKETLEIVNNTTSMPSNSGNSGVEFLTSLPPDNVIIRNNLSDSNVVINGHLWNGKPNSFEHWQVDHNGYFREVRSHMRATTDVVGKFTFLSTQTANADAWRIPSDSPLATGGSGGTLPSYIGALPPGPAPQDGDWFTRLRKHWSNENVQRPQTSSPAETPEPPQLADWLKGRTILTVSQDGKGQFKTIQEALNQVAPGQAVEVLDRGPYHERLSVTLPADCGLFSRVQTIVDFPRWEPGWMDPVGNNGKPAQIYLGYDFVGADRFRLHGIDFHFPLPVGTYEEGHWHQRLTIRTPFDCVIENCRIPRSGLGCADGEPVILSKWDSPDTTELSAVVRDCVIDGSLVVNTNMAASFPPDQRRGRVVLERLVFPAAQLDHHVLVAGQNLQQVTIRECLFTGNVKHNIALDQMSEQSRVNVTNCYLNGTYGVYFSNKVPEATVTIRNNIRTGEGMVHFDVPAGEFRDRCQQVWQVDHNCYAPVTTPNTPPVSLRPATSDILAQPQFLSTVFGPRDAFRLAADDRLGKAGVGEDLPTYLGPFPPGPAPAEGDWFTRLQKVWFDGNPPIVKQSSTPIVEPAPLEEWLEGRTILTVAQDGSGQFKTIQAALNALQTGQVVKVLDHGPYRERIELQSPPPDIGLISTVQTRIDLADMVNVGGQIQSRGHFVNKANRLRIHGFEFQIPQAPANFVTIGIYVSGSHAVVMEHCAVRRANSPGSQSLVIGSIRGAVDEPTVVRECFIEQGMQFYTLGPDGSAIVARNFFAGELHGLMAGGAFQQCVIRNNIFSGTLKFPFTQHVVHADWFELSNNTFFSFPESVLMESLASAQLQERAVRELKGEKNPQLSVDRGHAPTGRGAIFNNLHSRPGFLNVTGGAEDEPWTWQIGYNCYPGDGDIPARNALPRETNIIAHPVFYSIAPHDSDYARLRPDSPGSTSRAGAQWPNYTGALPPGSVPADGDWFTRLQQRWIKQE